MIGIPRPTRFNVPWEFVDSLIKVREYPVISEAGSFVDANRNELMKKAFGSEFLLMIDPDMVFTPEDISKIVKHMESGFDIVSGLCKRGEGGYYAAWNEKGDDYETIQEFPGELLECDAVGAGFIAINKQVIEKMQDSPFNFINPHGEDISFCIRAKELGFKIWIDSSIRIGHIRHSILY